MPPDSKSKLSLWPFCDCRNVERRLTALLHELKGIIMATQQEVDNLTDQVGAIQGVLIKIDGDIQFLKSQAQNPAITLDALKAAVADLQTGAEIIDAQTPDRTAP